MKKSQLRKIIKEEISKLLKEDQLPQVELMADYRFESRYDKSLKSRFARTISETLHLLDYYEETNLAIPPGDSRYPNADNITINSLFSEGEMDIIEDGDDFYAGPIESLTFFQSLPSEFYVTNNMDGDKESFKVTKTGDDSFSTEQLTQ